VPPIEARVFHPFTLRHKRFSPLNALHCLWRELSVSHPERALARHCTNPRGFNSGFVSDSCQIRGWESWGGIGEGTTFTGCSFITESSDYRSRIHGLAGRSKRSPSSVQMLKRAPVSSTVPLIRALPPPLTLPIARLARGLSAGRIGPIQRVRLPRPGFGGRATVGASPRDASDGSVAPASFPVLFVVHRQWRVVMAGGSLRSGSLRHPSSDRRRKW
jgi:hypothetical protein